ncbi:hypothetical protein ACSQ67_026279 [Phaseolus vulgaris]
MKSMRPLHHSMFIAARNWDLIPERSMSMVVPLLLDILWVLQLNRLILFIYHEPNADFVGEFSWYPFMTGACCVATLLNEMKRHGKDCRYGVISMCIGSGMGAAAVFERGEY